MTQQFILHSGDDYSLSILDFNVASMAFGERFCVDVSTVNDLLAEDREQFELHFESITPSGSAAVGDPDTVCVNIENNESMIVALFLYLAFNILLL